MDKILVSIISILLTIIASLLVYIWRSVVGEVKSAKVMFHNYTSVMFTLLSRLHPNSAAIIADAMKEVYEGRPNGRAKGVTYGQ